MSELPKGWSEPRLGELVEITMGQAPPGDECNKVGAGTPFVKAGEFTASGTPIIREWTTRPLKLAKRSDVLICVVGATCGKINYGADCAIGRSVAALSPSPALNKSYLYRFLSTRVNSLRAGATGSAQGVISKEALSDEPIPLAPLPEQRRIVAKLDRLFERTTSAREELAHIPTLVEHYKQAILRKAFSGELTADWREKQGRNEADTLTVGELVSDIRYGTAKKCYPEEHGVAVLRIPNVSGGQIVLSDLKYAELEERELRKLALQVGDILIVRSNGSPELVGRPALVTEQAEGLAYAGYLIRLRPNAEAIVPDYLKLMLESPQIRTVVEVAARSTSGVHNINSEELAALSIPCPETEEQLEIVRLIQAAFEWIERVSGERDKAATLLDHLDSGLLDKAFRGDLVPQDPADEPAELLLKRIGSERKAQASVRRARSVKLET